MIRFDRAIDSDLERLATLSQTLESRTGRQDEIEHETRQHSSLVAEASMRLESQITEVSRIEESIREQDAIATAQAEKVQSLESDLQSVRTRQEMELRESDELTLSVQVGEVEISEIETLLDEVQQVVRTEQLEFAKYQERLRGLREAQVRLQADQGQRVDQEAESNERYQSLIQAVEDSSLVLLRTQMIVAERTLVQEQLQGELRGVRKELEAFRNERSLRTRELDELHRKRRRAIESAHETQMQVREIDQRWTTLAQRIDEEYQLTLDSLMESGVSAFADHLQERFGEKKTKKKSTSEESTPDAPSANADAAINEADDGEAAVVEAQEISEKRSLAGSLAGEVSYEDVRPELEAAVDRLRRRLKMMGHVNTDALASLEEIENRFNDLSSQLKDLQEAKIALEDIIRRINTESKRLFLETFETIRQNFQILFRKVFGGGEGNIILENPEDVLECGIDIVARPPGKELRSLTLLSGGEKTMTAVGLLFAMFKSKPSPYCILDEVDAALDDANVGRYVGVVKEFAAMTQFVVITHRKPTMAAADVLYGVTMEQAGVSKRMAVRFDQVGDNCEILDSAKAA